MASAQALGAHSGSPFPQERPRPYLHSHLGGHSDNGSKLATTGKGGSLHWAHQTHRLTEVFSRLGTPPKTPISSPTIVPKERKMCVAFPIPSVKHTRKPGEGTSSCKGVEAARYVSRFCCWMRVVEHDFSPGTQQAEAGGHL